MLPHLAVPSALGNLAPKRRGTAPDDCRLPRHER